jgi:amino acid transporter
MTSVFGALNGTLLVGPRLLFAMGQDRLAPASLGRLHHRYQTPVFATAVMAGWSCLLVLLVGGLTHHRLPVLSWGSWEIDVNIPAGKSPFDVMTDFAIFGAVTFETLAVASIFVFRRRIPVNAESRPYRCWGYPFVPIIYVLAMAAVVFTFFATPEQRSEAVVGVVFIALGAFVYLIIFREREG